MADERGIGGSMRRISVVELMAGFYSTGHVDERGMKSYQSLLRLVLEEGRSKSDHGGRVLYSSGHRFGFDLQKGFPLLTTKKLHLRSIIHELLWFLKGDTNIGYLKDNGVSIWDEWADAEIWVGCGAQWCDWRSVDGRSIHQIDEVIESIQKTRTKAHCLSLERGGNRSNGIGSLPCLVQFCGGG